MNDDWIPHWPSVIRVMEQRFPRELEIAMLTVRVAQLQAEGGGTAEAHTGPLEEGEQQ